MLTGTPSSAGNFVLTVAVTDSAHSSGMANGNFSVIIAAPLLVTNTSLPNGSPGIVYSVTLAATGGFSPYTWSITQGALPGGLTLNATSGLISGTPTASGTSSFTMQVSDNGTPAATANASLSIVINPPPARSAALYVADQTGYQIQSDGSLTLLPSSPESAMNGYNSASSPTLPLLFTVAVLGGPGITGHPQVLESLLVNPDYSLTLHSSSAALPSTDAYAPASVDPTGSNLYLPGFIDSGQTTGVFMYPADGSLQPLGTIAIPNLSPPNARVVFTPDGTLAFISTCPSGAAGSILSYSRVANGSLTSAATYTLPGVACALGLTVSPDGKYLADWDNQGNGVVQVFSIASNGILTPATSPFTVTYDPTGTAVGVSDMTWDSSGSFLLPATSYTYGLGNLRGGVAVLSFSANSLTETVYPTGNPVANIVTSGSFVYAHEICRRIYCPIIDGFEFQNSQLTPLPGSPWTSNAAFGPGGMVIY